MSEMTEARPAEMKFQLCLTLLIVLAAYCALDAFLFDKRLMDSRLELQRQYDLNGISDRARER